MRDVDFTELKTKNNIVGKTLIQDYDQDSLNRFWFSRQSRSHHGS